MSPAERDALKKVYPTKSWSDKVDKMTDKQAFAVLQRLQNKKK